MSKAKFIAAAVGAALLSGLSGSAAGPHGTSEPLPTCTVSQSEFDGWKNGSASTLAFVPPDSSAFHSLTNCGFYKWSSQMFLWLTSRTSSGNLTMFSPTFYNAIESTASGAFQLVQNHEGVGPANAKISHVVFAVRVNKPKVLLLRLHKNPKDGSTGQAGGGVLVVRGDAVPVDGKPGYATYPVVYYAIEVNDVFAGLQAKQASVPYYVKGRNATNFPITQAEAQQIATAAGTSYSDLNQLAIETKSSWVDTAYLTPDQAAGLVTIVAEVPAFTQSTGKKGNLELSWDGTTMVPRKLALVGMHVVGSVAHHPAMIWATFESVFNSPDNTYAYLNRSFTSDKDCQTSKTCLTTVPLSAGTSSPTIFYNGPSGASKPPRKLVQTASSGDNNTSITSIAPTLKPTDVVRYNPWGNLQPASPSPADPIVINNTALLSLKTSLEPRLAQAGGDGTALANYFLLGAIWTTPASPPHAQTPQFGSHHLANTTMETFQQVSPQNHDKNATATNCFNCHNSTTPGTDISHVFPNVTGEKSN